MNNLNEMILAGDLRSLSGAPRQTEAERAEIFREFGLDYQTGLPLTKGE